MTLTPGTRLGRYEIRRSLGAGGMGEVYLARDPDLEREVAIKVLRGDREESADRSRRFVQEAKATSALNHPNIAHVYEIGSEDGLRFIVMEVVEGETLRRQIARGPMTFDDVLSLGSQIVAGVAAAHKAGIIHRDLKPENIIVRPDGYVKVLDFGLAKLVQTRDQNAETLLRTGSGVVLGTLHYMAPEQFTSADVTAAADVFSLGVVLFEMVTGRRPFEGEHPTAVASAILSRDAPSASAVRVSTPPHLAAVIAKALQKDPLERYPSAGELLEELKQISREATVVAVDAERSRSTAPRRRRAVAAVAALVAVAGGATTLMTMRHTRAVRAASDAVTRAQALLEQKRFADAYETVRAAEAVLPGDARVASVIARASTRATFTSDPAGATVSLQRFHGPPARISTGITPLTIEHLPRADYIVTFEKQGYAPATRMLPIAPQFLRGWQVPGETATVAARLLETARVPEGMVFVEGAPYRLSGWWRATDAEVSLSDYFIDRYEVSNREFEQFVRAGGYRRRELWRHPFVRNGRTLPFDEAMVALRDSTGLPGPRDWNGGAPPAGRENHPVTQITWYEAAAFAEWKGKSLPTIFQWQKAGRYPFRGAVGTVMPWGPVIEGVDVTERANFLGKGTMAVDSMPFGISPWGASHMAGNVAEWCVNPSGPGYAVEGGSWNDAVYAFGRHGALPPFFSSDQVGFRCVKLAAPGADQGSFAVNLSTEVPQYKPVDDRTYAGLRQRYDYAKTPLNARIVETVDTPDWRREKLEYDVGGKRVPAYLYIPKGFKPPLQVIHFAPAGDVASGNRALDGSIEAGQAPFIRGGRALFSVVMEGFVGRPAAPGFEEPDSRSDEYVDFVVTQVTELRRGLDVLETRKDLDMSKLGFLGPSAGSFAGLILTAVEPRYRSVVFVGTRLRSREMTDAAAANRIHFAPRIAAPKLMLQGRYDESAPLATDAEPLFRILREPKRMDVYEGSHVPPQHIAVPIISKWFDDTLGPVAQ